MDYSAARRIHVLLMSWLTLMFLTAWLPLLRSAMDGPSYEWGGGLLGYQFSGAGLSGDYWFVVVKAVLGLALLWFGWRRPNGGFRLVLVAWLALSLADTVYSAVTSPENFRFQGDTLGIDISLTLVAPALDALLLGLGAWWAMRAPPLEVPPLARTNRALLAIFALLLPVQYFLLSSGQGQDTNDVVGVLLTITGWCLMSAGLGRWGIRPAQTLGSAAAT